MSLHCFKLANAKIYRNLNLTVTNFHDEENSVYHAADTLQTILASEYDYGRWIKSFRMGIVEDNVEPSSSRPADPMLMSRILWDTKSDSSRFLNTVLLLMIRRAKILETFRYGMRTHSWL